MRSFQKWLKEMDNTIFNSIILFLITLTFLIFISSYPVSAFNITTDETTETSIIWNLSALPAGTNITSIALDGMSLTGFVPNPKQLVQNNLYAGETHLISVIDSTGNESTGEATTIINTAESEKAAATFNLWILAFFSLIFLCAAVFTGINLLGYVSLLLAFTGILTSIGNSFITGCIFVIMFVSSALVAYDWS